MKDELGWGDTLPQAGGGDILPQGKVSPGTRYRVDKINRYTGTTRPMTLKLGMQHQVLEYYQVCSNDNPRLTMTYFTTRSNLVPYACVWEKGKTMDFSETSQIVYDIKVRRCS